MNYKEVTFSINPYNIQTEEVLLAVLEQSGFDSFWQDGQTLHAYIATDKWNDSILAEIVAPIIPETAISWEISDLPNKNWNEEWEKNFEPVLIDSICYVRAPFHRPLENIKYDIVIEPKMSFGTGHHATTELMLKQILAHRIAGKSVLDMGCGTGILSLLCFKMKSNSITAIDNDTWAVENARENFEKNNAIGIQLIQGDKRSIPQEIKFDIVLANINRNIILNDLQDYISHLSPDGLLMLSGYLEADADMIHTESIKHGMKEVDLCTKNGWISQTFRFSN